MSGLRGLSQIVGALRMFVPLPVLVALVALLFLAVAPIWLENARTKEVRGLVRQISRSGQGEEAERLTERALGLADRRTGRLVELGREAHRRQLTRLRDRAWERLAELDADMARRERTLVQPVPTRDRFPLEAHVAVAGMIESGAWEAARSRLDLALARFPGDPELLALRERLDAADRDASV